MASQVLKLKVKDELEPQIFKGDIKASLGTLLALTIKDPTLAAISVSKLLLYKGELGMARGWKEVEVLADLGTSYIFILKDTAQAQPHIVWDNNTELILVKLPSDQEMKIEGYRMILLWMGTWTGKIEV